MGVYPDVDAYLEYLKEVRRLSELTIRSYRHDLEVFLAFLESRSIALDEVTVSDARHYSTHIISEKKYGVQSVNRMLSTLRGFFRHQVKKGRSSTNPFLRIGGSPRYRRLPEVLSRNEVLRILSLPIHSFFDLRDALMFHLFYSTGCRLSELLSVDLGDIDIPQERLLVKGKGNRQRFVFLNPSTIMLLERYLEQRRLFIDKNGPFDAFDANALLLGKQGKRLSASSVHSIFGRYRLKLGLSSRFTPHMFRHSFATHLLDNDSGIRLVQELLGHASISTTQIYTHVSHERLRSVYERSHPHGRNRDGD
jgi:site-specific recombinase XerD